MAPPSRPAVPPALRRTLAAALVGLALPPLAWALTAAGLAVLPYDPSARFGQGAVILLGAAPFLLVTAWPSLWAVRVRPAWHVALPAPPAAFLLWTLLDTVAWQLVPNRLVAVCLVLGLAYALTALFTTPGMLWWAQQVPLMAVGGPPPLVAPTAPPRRPLDPGIPLIAPDLPGYVVERVASRPGELRYVLRPAALHRAATPGERSASAVTVVVRSRVDPPGEDGPYEQAGPRTWSRAVDGGTIHVVDRDDATVVVRAGSRVPEAVLRRATSTLAPRPPSHFTPTAQD
ncbi:hypothetical protein GCM10009530_14370 [Microbispora corallina]|uniref:DUF4367 domain-containing protein n=1 Tax=Microbispora corallina TaxID=83302 RepID=A0ABQ4FSQ1_9ACTN|nr:hypothetical protein [Microbispora corallina]GIH37867.1 hypothetical protein Mco01_08670 [Microbispora corallina]